MGNCQAAEAATVVIQHPGGNKVDRIYWSISAHEVMSSNPGHYVALLITSPPTPRRTDNNGVPVKQLKLLRPDDTLLMGQVYRLVTFEDVLKEFAAKKSVKLGKLIKECGGLSLDSKKIISPTTQNSKPILVKNAEEVNYRAGSRGVVGGRHHGGGGGGQWKPALQSISEIET